MTDAAIKPSHRNEAGENPQAGVALMLLGGHELICEVSITGTCGDAGFTADGRITHVGL
jgi:hypothetical protein